MNTKQPLKNNAPEFEYIDSQAGLTSLVKALSKATRVAVDTEGDSLYHYFKKVCLIQLNFDQQTFLVDPLVECDMIPLMDSLAEKDLVLHGGEYDLRMLRAEYGWVSPVAVFDTMLAAQLLGRDKLGLADLAREICEIELPKGDKKSDWSARPLSDNQLAYAANDTRYLFEIADTLQKDLERARRTEWMNQTTAAMVESTTVDKAAADPDFEWRIKGIRKLSGRELALVREIWRFRDSEAQRADRPPFRILGNQSILDLAYSMSNQKADEFSVKLKLPRHFDKRRRTALNVAIKKALSLPAAELPDHPKPKPTAAPPPEADLLREIVATEADKYDLPPSVLAPRAAIEAIARQKADSVEKMVACSKLMKWQAEILLPKFKEVIDKIA